MFYYVKKFMRKGKVTKAFYDWLRVVRDDKVHTERLKGKYEFDNRSKSSEKLCIILSGYKEIVWEDVFGRIKNYLPGNIDFCIITSGIVNDELRAIAKKNNWSYLSTQRNCVTLAQNIAINLFPQARYIYKLDEDIFINKGFYEILWNTYNRVREESFYNIGFVAPLIPINGFTYIEVLKHLGLIDKYEELFQKPYISAEGTNPVVCNPEVAKFFWGEGGFVPKIDEINTTLQKEPFDYMACPIRFSIGAIMFPRETWEDMGYFKVEAGNCLGLDEIQLCEFCVSRSRVMIVSKNCCVGHMSFGPQNREMIEYFTAHRDRFKAE